MTTSTTARPETALGFAATITGPGITGSIGLIANLGTQVVLPSGRPVDATDEGRATLTVADEDGNAVSVEITQSWQVVNLFRALGCAERVMTNRDLTKDAPRKAED
jgi:hypothetical protein